LKKDETHKNNAKRKKQERETLPAAKRAMKIYENATALVVVRESVTTIRELI
jgi:hypothetical protein